MQTVTRRSRVAGLVAINALLAGVALAGVLVGRAGAQPGTARLPGRYTVIPGKVSGISGSVLYVIDSANQEMIALRYQRAQSRLEPFAFRSIAADAAEGRTR